jgi:hypothetical protein
VEELTKAVLEGGAVQDRGDHFILDRSLQGGGIPVTLNDALMARLDRIAGGKGLCCTDRRVGNWHWVT